MYTVRPFGQCEPSPDFLTRQILRPMLSRVHILRPLYTFCEHRIIENYRLMLKLKWIGLYTYYTKTNTMNPSTCTYNRPITLREIKRHNQFKGAYGNLTQDLDIDFKKRVRDLLRGLEYCGFSVEKITLVKKYVDAHYEVNNRDESIRVALKEIYSLASEYPHCPPKIFDEHYRAKP